MDPLTARKLTLEEAIFYLRDEKSIKSECLQQNRQSLGAEYGADEQKTARNAMMRRLREKYTGKTELENG